MPEPAGAIEEREKEKERGTVQQIREREKEPVGGKRLATRVLRASAGRHVGVAGEGDETLESEAQAGGWDSVGTGLLAERAGGVFRASSWRGFARSGRVAVWDRAAFSLYAPVDACARRRKA